MTDPTVTDPSMARDLPYQLYDDFSGECYRAQACEPALPGLVPLDEDPIPLDTANCGSGACSQ